MMNSLYQYRDLPGNRNPPISDKNEALKNPPKNSWGKFDGKKCGREGEIGGLRLQRGICVLMSVCEEHPP